MFPFIVNSAIVGSIRILIRIRIEAVYFQSIALWDRGG